MKLYEMELVDLKRKEFIENELGLTVKVINHRTMRITDGGTTLILYPTKFHNITTGHRDSYYSESLEYLLRKEFDLYTISSGYLPKLKNWFEALSGIEYFL